MSANNFNFERLTFGGGFLHQVCICNGFFEIRFES